VPYVLLSGFGADDDDLDVLATVAALLDHGDRLVVDDGVLLVPALDRAEKRRRQSRARQKRYRRALRESVTPRNATRNADLTRSDAESARNSSGYNPLSPRKGLEREGYPGESDADALRVTERVTRNAVTRNGTDADDYEATSPRADASRWELPPMTAEQRETNRAAADEIRERMRRGEL
jgi:hypothetical protein